jgi:hypothetical protein
MAAHRSAGPIRKTVQSQVNVNRGARRPQNAQPLRQGAAQVDADAETIVTPATVPAWNEGVSGSSLVVGTGISAVTRIPVPGTNGLFVELKPRGWTPKTGSTSTLFIQDVTGKRHLRLDYGFNVKSGTVDYHWNQKGTFSDFKITDHAPAGTAGEILYSGARYLRYGGRVLLVVGLALDVYSIVVAKKHWRQVARVAAGWAGAWAGCEGVGALGAEGGTLVEPGLGTAVGGLGGCIVGGIAGYAGASWAAGHAYDWVEETFFETLPEVPAREAVQ